MNYDYSDTQARTYRLRLDTVRRLDQLAGQENLWQSTLIDALLTQALDDLDAGRLRITRRAVKYELAGLVRS